MNEFSEGTTENKKLKNVLIVQEITKMILNGGGIYQGVRIPASQTGTTTQQVAYARLTAERIYNENKAYFHLLLE